MKKSGIKIEIRVIDKIVKEKKCVCLINNLLKKDEELVFAAINCRMDFYIP